MKENGFHSFYLASNHISWAELGLQFPSFRHKVKAITHWGEQTKKRLEVGLLSHFSNKIIIIKSLNNLTGGRECSRLVLSSLVPVLEELGTTEIPLQTQLYPLNRRVDYLTQDRRHCAPSLDLDLIPHHFHHLYHLLLDLQTSLDLLLSLHQVMEF